MKEIFFTAVVDKIFRGYKLKKGKYAYSCCLILFSFFFFVSLNNCRSWAYSSGTVLYGILYNFIFDFFFIRLLVNMPFRWLWLYDLFFLVGGRKVILSFQFAKGVNIFFPKLNFLQKKIELNVNILYKSYENFLLHKNFP